MSLAKKAIDWVDTRIGIREVARDQLTEYLVPKNINVWYSLGFLALFVFIIQIITGIFLLTYYVPDVDKAFQSIDKIMNDVPFGWLFRLIHAIGANMMVIALILHALSTVFMGSYKKPRELHWISGFTLLLLTLTICLSGYLLPWSQLSYWATTVATNSPGSIPIIGEMIVKYTRGGDLVGPVTLGRFFAIHVVAVPLIMILLVGLHMFLLRRTGISAPPVRGQIPDSKPASSGRYKKEKHTDGIPFFPHYIVEDVRTVVFYLLILTVIVVYYPNLFFTREAFIPANPFSTPAHIKPEWYFLASYQTLKIFPSELAGVLIQGAAVLFLFLLPFIDRGRRKHFLDRPVFSIGTIIALIVFVLLSYWGHVS